MLKYFTHRNLVILLLLIAACFAIFLNLDANYIYLWDEGTYAVNAYEMHLDGDYLVKHYDGLPEMWATNPPLVCYLQVICFKIFGPGELAVRLPSGLAALGIVLMIIRFSIKEKLGLDFATYAVLILVTAKGYITYHVTRTGDLDSVLIFFIIGSIMYFYKFIEYEEKKIKYLFIFSAFLLFGYFAKGIACFLILPAFLIYAIVKNKVLYVLKTKQLYYCILSVLLLICSYYFFRELRTPGYVSFMLGSEFGRWYTEGSIHNHPWFFYLLGMYDKDFTYFLFAIPAVFILFIFLPKDNIYKKKSTIWLISFVTFMFLISWSKTKLEWYEAPVYPMVSIYIALGLKSILDFKNYSYVTSVVAKSVFIFVLFSVPYISQIQDDLKKEEGWHDTKFGQGMRQYNQHKNVPKKFVMLTSSYNGHALFYKLMYNNKYGYNISIHNVAGIPTMGLAVGEVYAITHPGIIDYLKANFNYELYMDDGGMVVAKTISLKNNPVKVP